MLIVIAIIAILIGIAIPAFSSSLDAAKLQTDHANIRSAYGIFQTARISGVLDGITLTTDDTYYFLKDGTISSSKTNAYALQVTPKNLSDCVSSIGCKKNTKIGITEASHTQGNLIQITFDADGGEDKFTMQLIAVS